MIYEFVQLSFQLQWRQHLHGCDDIFFYLWQKARCTKAIPFALRLDRPVQCRVSRTVRLSAMRKVSASCQNLVTAWGAADTHMGVGKNMRLTTDISNTHPRVLGSRHSTRNCCFQMTWLLLSRTQIKGNLWLSNSPADITSSVITLSISFRVGFDGSGITGI